MNGWTGAGSPLAKGFPIREPAPFQIRAMPRQEGMKPGIPEFEDLFSGTEPVVPFAHAVDLLPGTTILLTIGEEPLLVEQEVGDGKILVFLGTAYGPDSEDAFWNWPKWPHLLARVLYQ